MTKRYGTKRGEGCECTSSFTCRACLHAAGPTLGEARPHNEAVFLQGVEQHAFEQAQRKGERYAAERLSAARDGATSANATNRRYWGAVKRGTERALNV